MAKRIFVVDDDPSVCDFLALMLNEIGYEVETTTNGTEALPYLQDKAFDLVSADYRMPEMNGEELADEIKRQLPWLPVVLITASIHYHTAPHIDQILRKPFSLQQLQETVDSLT